MNKFLAKTLISLALVCGPIAVSAQTLSADFIKEEVVVAVQNDLISQGFQDVEVNVLGVPFQTLELPDGQFKMQIVKNAGSGYSKRCIKPLRVYVNGRLIRAFGVPLEITAYKEALVATKEIKIGQAINASNSVMKVVEVDGNHNNLVSKNMIQEDIIAQKLYRIGQPVDKRFAKIRSDVQKDEIVTVIFNSTELVSVSIKAKAMATGSKGDMVAVQNCDTKKVYYGQIIDKNTVKVSI